MSQNKNASLALNHVYHQHKKRFGQHFLHDDYLIGCIIEKIDPQLKDNMVEIGPGHGALTKPLLDHVSSLRIIELDRDIVNYWRHTYTANSAHNTKLEVFAADVLQFDFTSLGQSLRIVGNLPYNISTPLLFKLSNYSNVQDVHCMLQQEIINRICARPNTHAYGRLSVMLQVKFVCYELLSVPPDAFTPAPKVQSGFIRLIPKQDASNVNIENLSKVVTAAFGMRRKTIANSLRGFFSEATLTSIGIDPKYRAENITVSDYVRLSRLLEA